MSFGFRGDGGLSAYCYGAGRLVSVISYLVARRVSASATSAHDILLYQPSATPPGAQHAASLLALGKTPRPPPVSLHWD